MDIRKFRAYPGLPENMITRNNGTFEKFGVAQKFQKRLLSRKRWDIRKFRPHIRSHITAAFEYQVFSEFPCTPEFLKYPVFHGSHIEYHLDVLFFLNCSCPVFLGFHVFPYTCMCWRSQKQFIPKPISIKTGTSELIYVTSDNHKMNIKPQGNL